MVLAALSFLSANLAMELKMHLTLYSEFDCFYSKILFYESLLSYDINESQKYLLWRVKVCYSYLYVYLWQGGGDLLDLNVYEQHINKMSVKFLSKAYVIIS